MMEPLPAPEVTVVVPVRNGAHTVQGTLASILRQQGVAFEVVVVDDGSVDETPAVVEAIDDVRVRLVRGAAAGVGRARNAGVAAAAAPLVTFLDADDVALDGWLATLVELLADPEVGLASCAIHTVRAGHPDSVLRPTRLGPAHHEIDALFLAGTFCLRRQLLLDLGGYRDLAFGENTELGLRIAAELHRRELRAVASAEPLVRSARPPLWIYDQAAIVRSAEYVLDHHAGALAGDRRLRADYLTAAGVGHARLGHPLPSRRQLRAAVLARPDLRALGRWLVGELPALPGLLWPARPAGRGSLTPQDREPPALDLTVVVPIHQGEATLPDLLDSLARQTTTLRWEVVIVDDRSSDAGRAIAERRRGELPLRVTSGHGAGVAAARNLGASQADGAVVVFVDQDDVVADGFLEAIASAIEGADIAGPKLDCETLNPGWVRATRELPQEHGLGDGDLPWVYGSGLAIRRTVFDVVGGFDEQFTEGSEDVDLCWRAGNRGYRVTYAPAAVLRYRFRRALPDILRQARSYGRAGARLQAKYRAAGVTRPRWETELRVAGGALRLALLGPDRPARARGLAILANRIGRLQGAWRYRVPYW